MCQNASACRRTACCSRSTGSVMPAAAQAGPGTYFDLMRRAFIEKAAAQGYEVIDLDTRFIPRHARTGESFEFSDDNHWNGAGSRCRGRGGAGIEDACAAAAIRRKTHIPTSRSDNRQTPDTGGDVASVELRGLTKRYRQPGGRRQRLAAHRARAAGLPARALGLRQDHDAAADRGLHRADRRRDRGRRPRGVLARRARCRPSSATCR